MFSIIFPETLLAGNLDWSVVNRFPLFRETQDFIGIEKIWSQSTSPEEFLTNQSSASLRRLLPIAKTMWSPVNGTYDTELFNPTHTIKLEYQGSSVNTNCTWFFNGNKIGEDFCKNGFVLDKVAENELFSINVITDNSENHSLESQKISTELILGLGDSFASGEGNPDHPVEFSEKSPQSPIGWLNYARNKGHLEDKSAKWWDQACHRSLLSWQALFALNRAITNRKSVVRFASFACSGAEIYDGFFHAQIAPPGALERKLKVPNVTWSSKTDGGPIYTTKNQFSNSIVEDTAVKPKLLWSQLNASIHLLCDGSIKKNKEMKEWNKPSQGQGKVFYGKFSHSECDGTLRKPDFLLLSFGGNDVYFGGVVRWSMVPKTVKLDPLYLVRKAGIISLRQVLAVVDPSVAGSTVEHQLSTLYFDLERAISELLHVNYKQTKVVSLIYPDPLPTKNQMLCSNMMASGNEAFGQLFGAGWTYSFDATIVKSVREKFIEPLRKRQRDITPISWTQLDSQESIIDSGLCSQTQCIDNKCKLSNAYGWFNKKNNIDYLTKVIDWEAYTPERSRGFRTANDAALTQSTFIKNDKINMDWLAGAFHPTYKVHTLLANKLQEKVSTR